MEISPINGDNLGVISMSASGIKLWQEDGLYSQEEVKTFVKSILSSAQYLSDTIDDFRNFYQEDLEKSDFEVKKSSVTLITFRTDVSFIFIINSFPTEGNTLRIACGNIMDFIV